MIKALIIEDEQKSREMMVMLVEKKCPQLNLLGAAKNVKEGVELINSLNPELIFLDISMPDGTGFDLLEQVQGKNSRSFLRPQQINTL